VQVNQGERPIRVLVADDDRDIRDLLAAVIEGDPAFELAGMAADAEEAVRLATELEPDVAILDTMMPAGGGAGAARQITATTSTRVIALTAMDAAFAYDAMMNAGAAGFLSKGCTNREVLDAVRAVATSVE
jgi:two-component system, NarL family, invasion response regulator UvrY